MLSFSDSALSDLVLGASSAPVVPTQATSLSFYRVQVFAYGGSFGVGSLVADLHNVKAVGWAIYLNDVPEAFFTLLQHDPKAALLKSYLGKAHVRISRDGDVVFAGLLMEDDAIGSDVIFYAYGYAAALFWMHTAWNQEWTSKTVQQVVTDLWTRAQTTLTNSLLSTIATGTIESPVTTTGGSTAIILPLYTAFYKRILFVFQEMAALANSDTDNTVVFEITHEVRPSFNLWKNRGVARPDVVWEYGGVVKSFRHSSLPVFRRNVVLGVGATPRDALLRDVESDATDMAAFGRHEESIFLAWVRDDAELARVSKSRLARGKRDEVDLSLSFFPNSVMPPVTGAPYRLSDKVTVKIEHGATSVNGQFLVSAVQVLSVRGNEYVNARVQSRV